jgi:large subunit ribosomal protein L3
VTQVKTEAKEGYTAVQVGVGSKKAKQVTKPLAGHFLAAGLPIKRHLAEFRVTPDALLPVGTPLAAAHFKAGQYVDVSGTTIGKGFAGVMKRWNFRGQGASHGNSLAHRALGSTGGRQDPGRTWKGKKMPGRMGGERRTVHSLLVQRVDGARGLLYLHGQVPGHSGGVLEVKDALRKPPSHDATVPFPTYVEPQPGALAAMEPQVAPVQDDPFDRVRPVRNDSKTGS